MQKNFSPFALTSSTEDILRPKRMLRTSSHLAAHVCAGNRLKPKHLRIVNERADGSRDWGTFEGTFRLSDGTGKLARASGQGTYKTRLTSPTELECRWHGRYELAVSAQAA